MNFTEDTQGYRVGIRTSEQKMLKKKMLKSLPRQINKEMYSWCLFLLDADMAKRFLVFPAKG
ncbi:hypothetical protein VU01_102712 [Candidatus Electrothrix marina]|uniref:Uncharacterized protein n=1 Tax=Candidatus Electrothrix marina TaxID=1859130 RepID=A0A444JGJ3_9BACT|nr:hypothetical protein VU01_102712 [Candidatus Electrothrix marina]